MAVISMKTNDDKRVELEIQVSAEDFGKAVDAVFKKNVKKIQVPGFRRGKAPRKMIEKMYGEGVFYEEAVNNTYPAAYEAAVEEKALEPVDHPEIEITEIGKDGYTFKALVTVKPEVTLGEYKGLAVEKKEVVVSDDEVNAELDRELQKNARIVPVEGRTAQNDDTATIDFEGFVDGVAFEGGKGESYPLVLGSNTFIPGFEGQVVGHSIGDAFDVNVTFPEEYHAEELKGKAAVFKCTLKELKMKELPTLDDEFAKDVSEFDTLEELKADIRSKILARKQDEAQTEVEDKLMELVAQNMTVDVPECMYETRITDLIREFEYRLRSQGLNLQTYLQYSGNDMETFRATYRDQAVTQVRTRLALEKIVEQEKLEATQEEMDVEFEKLGKAYGMTADKVKEILPAKEVIGGITMNKALDLIRDSAVITEVKAQEEQKKPARKPRAKKKTEEETAEVPTEE
ncbi:MAG: trigger factor [Anaerotruncus sp.]|nr:trigger factor [Anaerotruncus sp.]